MVSIGGGELGVILVTLALLAAQLGVLVALVLWGRWVARRQGGGLWWFAAWSPVLAMVAQVLGVVATAGWLAVSFSGVEAVPPEARAQALADQISVAMGATAVGTVASAALLLAGLVVAIVGTLRAPAGGA